MNYLKRNKIITEIMSLLILFPMIVLNIVAAQAKFFAQRSSIQSGTENPNSDKFTTNLNDSAISKNFVFQIILTAKLSDLLHGYTCLTMEKHRQNV